MGRSREACGEGRVTQLGANSRTAAHSMMAASSRVEAHARTHTHKHTHSCTQEAYSEMSIPEQAPISAVSTHMGG